MKSTLIILLTLLTFATKAQVLNDSIPQDSLRMITTEEVGDSIVKKKFTLPKTKVKKKVKNAFQATKNFFNFKKDYPSPKKALLLTAILPGNGQIYNKKYWKLPLVYGGVGSMVYFITFTRGQYRRYRKAYIYRLDEDGGTIDEFDVNGQELLSAEAIKLRRDQFRKRHELSYVGLGFAYILAGVDAFVDAHLMRFDVSDDLTMQWQPHYEFSPNSDGALGVHLSLQPKGKREVVYPVKFME